MKVLELQQCPACGGTDFLAFDLGGGNWLRKCRTCETVSAREYADPAEVYVDGYMFGQAGAFGLDVTHPVFQEYLLRVARRRIALIEGATGARGSLLDVGCGTGEVLFAAREHGWQVQGVEPERTAAEMTRERGIPVEVAPLEDSGLRERTYDVVTAFHVLEHVPDSRAFLRMLARWARPGGHVAVEVPNWGSSARRRHGNNWSGLRPLEHLVHFTPKTLLRTFRAAGLDPVLSRSPVYLGPPQTLEHALDDLVRHGRFRKVIEPLSPYRQVNGDSVRVPSAAGWKLLRAVEAVYDRAGTGGVVLCVARVP